jgi:hypothetical protein
LFANIGRRRLALAAENLFLRKQLALFREREKKALPTTPADRFVFSKLARWFDWRSALVIVKPATLIGWHRAAFRRFWRWKSRSVGRPQVTTELRKLIRRLAAENPTWGEKRIADELFLKLQIRLSPRTVAKYSKQLPSPRRSRDQRWSTFLKNHAYAIVACDFFTAVTATFRVIYVFVALEIGSRRLIHFNATEHPTAEWTLQQLREALPGDQQYKFLLHDRHQTFSAGLDEEIERWGITVLKSPAHAPTANAFCERLIGTIRRECLETRTRPGTRHPGPAAPGVVRIGRDRFLPPAPAPARPLPPAQPAIATTWRAWRATGLKLRPAVAAAARTAPPLSAALKISIRAKLNRSGRVRMIILPSSYVVVTAVRVITGWP